MDPQTTTTTSTADEFLLQLPVTLAMVGVGRSTWLAKVRNKEAPQPVKVGHKTLWVKTEVQAWVRAQIKAYRNAD